MTSPQVLYVGGWGRSGSTLLSHLLGRLPEMVAVGELRYVWQAGVSGNELCGCGEPFDECPFWVAVGEEAFGGWDKIDLGEVLGLEAAVLRHSRIPMLAAPRLFPAQPSGCDATPISPATCTPRSLPSLTLEWWWTPPRILRMPTSCADRARSICGWCISSAIAVAWCSRG